jgi:DNA-directed RNA polymerase subunit beta
MLKDGVIEYVDANIITISTYVLKKKEWLVLILMKTYNLIKFRKTNQGTSINLKPIVEEGMSGSWTSIIEGYATQNGELALGRNLKVAFIYGKV